MKTTQRIGLLLWKQQHQVVVCSVAEGWVHEPITSQKYNMTKISNEFLEWSGKALWDS